MSEKRKSRRFDLKLPFELLREGSEPVHVEGETCNLSSVGVLFTAPSAPTVGEPIEYMITLPSGPRDHNVHLRCVGKVVRTGRAHSEPMAGVSVAATLERYEFMR